MDGGRTQQEYGERLLGDAEKSNNISQRQQRQYRVDNTMNRRNGKMLNRGSRLGSTDTQVQRRFWLVEVSGLPFGFSGDKPILVFFHVFVYIFI